MGLAHSPKVVTDGLVFYYDTGNTDKSWKGPPVTNLAKNASNQIDWTVSSLSQNVTRSTITPDEVYRITSTTGTSSSFRIRFDNAVLVNNATYTVSYRFKLISGGPTFRANDWGDAAITRTTTALPGGVFYETATGTRAVYDSTYRFLDFEMSNNTVVEISDLQLEERTFATPYSSRQVRSNTQALLDLTNLNTITANNLTYANNNTFSFNGANNFINAGNNAVLDVGNNITVNAWVFIGSNASYQPIITKVNSGFTLGWELANSSGFLRSTLRPAPIDLSAGALTINRWHMATMTFNGTTLSLYVNGVLQGSTTGGAVTLNSTQDLFVGARPQGNYFNGNISNAQVYNRALTAEEIRQNFNALRGRYGI